MQSALTRDDFVWLAGSLCQLHRIPFDPQLLLQRFPAPHSVQQLLEATASLGFKTGKIVRKAGGLGAARLPCIGFLKGESPRPALLVKADTARVVYVRAGEQNPTVAQADELDALFERELVLARREAAPTAMEQGDGAAPEARFGFRWFWTELLRHRKVWRDVLAASLFIQLIALGTPLGTQVIIDKVVVHQTTSTLLVIAVGLGMFLLFNAAMGWLRQYLVLHTGQRVDAVLGSQVFRRIMRLCLPYFQHRPTGTLVARVHAVETIREFMAGAAVSLILDLPFLFVFLAVMFWYSWQLSLIALGLLIVIVALSIGITPVLRARLNKQFLLGARNQAFLTEYVSGIETVKSLQMEPRLESRYDDYLASYLAAGFSTRQLSNTYNVVANALEQAMTLSILCVGALLVMRNDGFTIGMLVAFQMFAARMAQPMLRIAGLWQEFQQASIAVKRLGDIMNAPPEPYSLAPARSPDGAGAIALQGLSFRYSERHPYVFRNVTFAIRPGELVLVSGPSGSGKSTLAKLLLGFYRATDGRILIDSVPLDRLSANELRLAYGVVPQETQLFSGSVYDNVAMANPHASFEDIVAACRSAEIHGTIERLPQGYQTPLGEHGVGLSGGQKQRLAIARALLKRPRVLIFDEATSNLDRAAAELLAGTINQLKGKVTMVFIAHQVPSALQVDRALHFKSTP